MFFLSRLIQRIHSSLTLRFSLLYGFLGVVIIIFLLGFIFLQVMGALHAQQFKQITVMAKRVEGMYVTQGRDAVIDYIRYEIQGQSPDLWFFMDPNEHKVVGNIDYYPMAFEGSDYIADLTIHKEGRSLEAKLQRVSLGGDIVLVGKDLRDIYAFRGLMFRASLITIVMGLFFVVLSTYWFRAEIASNVSVIRRTAAHIRAGQFKRRIPVENTDDELNLLIKELNLMLDHLEKSLTGVRYLSETITHNLRTPIMRITSHLYPLAYETATPQAAQEKAQQVLEELESLTTLFDKLLQISELESGVYRQSKQSVNFSALLEDMVALYGPYAEEKSMQLETHLSPDCHVHGDADLLASALSNLLENACKYGHTLIQLRLYKKGNLTVFEIEDDGIGVSDKSLAKLGTHFYRDQVAEHIPGTGLGLTSVLSIVNFHQGRCEFYRSVLGGLGIRITLESV